SRRRHTRCLSDWSSDVCSSDLTSPNPSRLMVSFTNDDDFIFFHVPATGVAAATEGEITEMVSRLQRHVQARIEAHHGEEIAALRSEERRVGKEGRGGGEREGWR